MTFAATVVRVMIASPGDIPDARDAVELAIHSWNGSNAITRKVMLLPWRWENSSVPVMGDHPQALINSQGVDDSDIVIALFGARLGSATLEAISGTAEEIERARNKSIPVHVFFSTAPVSLADIDPDQLQALSGFKATLQHEGLLGEFANVTELQLKVWQAIDYDLGKMDLAPLTQPSTPLAPPVQFVVQPKQSREVSGYGSGGKPRYTNRHWVEVTNTGTEDAEDVVYTVVGDDSSLHLATDGEPTIVHAGQTRHLNTYRTFGGGTGVLRISWVEGDEARQKDFYID